MTLVVSIAIFVTGVRRCQLGGRNFGVGCGREASGGGERVAIERLACEACPGTSRRSPGGDSPPSARSQLSPARWQPSPRSVRPWVCISLTLLVSPVARLADIISQKAFPEPPPHARPYRISGHHL